MRKIIFIALTLFVSLQSVVAQENPVQWNFKAIKTGEKEYNLVAEADIKNGWFMYSQFLESNDGPIATSFKFDKNKFELVGKNEESGDIKKVHDAVFDMTLVKFAHKAVFTQKIKITGDAKEVKGSVEYMCCDEGMCLPPKQIPFSITL